MSGKLSVGSSPAGTPSMQRTALVRRQAAVVVQRAWRRYHVRQYQRKIMKRKHILKEMVELERGYVSNLAYICVLYQQPLLEKVCPASGNFDPYGSMCIMYARYAWAVCGAYRVYRRDVLRVAR